MNGSRLRLGRAVSGGTYSVSPTTADCSDTSPTGVRHFVSNAARGASTAGFAVFAAFALYCVHPSMSSGRVRSPATSAFVAASVPTDEAASDSAWTTEDCLSAAALPVASRPTAPRNDRRFVSEDMRVRTLNAYVIIHAVSSLRVGLSSG